MEKEQIKIIFSKTATTNVENDLVKLTEFITKKVFKGEWQGGGLLGGEFGYGVDFENDIFMMHRFCWCEKKDCGWCSYDDENNHPKNPNFLYKPTNTKIWWYKWIGRSQEQSGKLPKDWLKICKKSVK